MSALQPPPVHFDAVHRFTVEDYYRLAEVGLLDADARVELLDGQLVPAAPIGPEHHSILDDLTETLVRQQDGRYRVGPGRSLPIPAHDVPEPDLVLYRPGAGGRRRHLQASDVLLVIEISDSTLRRDLGFKASLYERAGIPEYWVIDVPNACLHVMTLAGAAYEKTVVRTGRLTAQGLPGIQVDVSALFCSDE